MVLVKPPPIGNYARHYHITDHAVDQLLNKSEQARKAYATTSIAEVKNAIDTAITRALSQNLHEDVIDDGMARRIVRLPTMDGLQAVLKRGDDRRHDWIVLTLLTEGQAELFRQSGKWMRKDATGELVPATRGLASLGDVLGEVLDKYKVRQDAAPPVEAPAAVTPPPESPPEPQPKPTPTVQPSAPPQTTAPNEEAPQVAQPEYDTTKWLLRDDAARMLKVSPQRLSAIATERKWKRLPLDKIRVAYPRAKVEAEAKRRGAKASAVQASATPPKPQKISAAEMVQRWDALCERLGVTTSELARRVGIASGASYHWRKGAPPSPRIVAEFEIVETAAAGIGETSGPVGRRVTGADLAARFEVLKARLKLDNKQLCKRLGMNSTACYAWRKGRAPSKWTVVRFDQLEAELDGKALAPAAAPVKAKPAPSKPAVNALKTALDASHRAPAADGIPSRVIRYVDASGVVRYMDATGGVAAVYEALVRDGVPLTSLRTYRLADVKIAMTVTGDDL